jgi:membrane protein DedA with SNARE-associated domain
VTHGHLASLLARYGYWTVLIGAFFEGETIVLMGGFTAHRGYLYAPVVALCAFVGSLAGDQTAYLVGRRYGKPILARRPKWRPIVELVRERLHERGTWLLVGFRFLYGLRNAVPFVAGLTGIPPRRFVPLNVLGAVLWAPTMTLAGYLFGEAVEKFLDHARKYEAIALIGLVAVGVMLYARHRVRDRPG